MATLFDSASLVMIPSGVKEDKLYSIKPTDGSGDFTFSRGSDIQATRVNSSGLIEKAKENLLLQSNSFDTTWTNTNSTDTGGQSGYDGTSNAWLLQSTIASGEAYLRQAISVSGSNTFSIYAKAGTSNFLAFYINATSGTDPLAYFNLSTGAVGSISATATASIVSVGSGWYRCSVAYNATISNIDVYVTTADGSFLSTTGDNIYIQDAQLNHGLIAQDYVETTTAAVVEGLTADLPRLDYSGGASCPSLLLEPSRTNALSHSEYMGNGGSSVDRNTSETLSPEGVYNAAKVTGSTSYLADSRLTSVFSGNNVFSVFLKKGNDSVIGLYIYDGAYYRAGFNLDTGAVDSETNTTASIEPYGNGWYRCTILATTTANVAEVGLDGLGGFVYTYGWQHEYNVTYETSYIPTYGTAANRGAESCYKTSISDLIGQTEGTIFGEIQKLSGDEFASWRFSISDNTNDNWIFLSLEDDFDLRVYVRKNGSTNNDSQINNKFVDDGVYKVALAYANNDVAVYVNGSLAYSSTSANIPNTTQFLVSGSGSQTGSSQNKKGKINQALLFKTRLTNAELAALTTI